MPHIPLIADAMATNPESPERAMEKTMTYSTIYDLDGNTLTDGVQSQRVCNATLIAARGLARARGRSVIVEDRGTEECYRVTPAGHIWRAPKRAKINGSF